MPLDVRSRTRATSAYGRLNFSLPPDRRSGLPTAKLCICLCTEVAMVTTVAIVELI